MRSAWSSVITGFQLACERSLVVSTLLLLALAFGTARPASAQTCPPSNLGDTCPITGTAGFETGLHNLAFVKLDKGGQGGDGATVYWGDHTETRGLVRCYEPVLHPQECHVFGTHRYAVPGTYTIEIKYNEPKLIGTGPEDTLTTHATISPVGDFVILSIGDSVASGEGDPVIQYGGAVGSQPNQGFWDDPGSDYVYPPDPQTAEQAEFQRDCHRSLIAGPAQAGGQVAATNPTTLVHFACSGATVYTQYKNTSTAVRQLRIARESLPRIDVLLISAGANNMHGTNSDGSSWAGFGDVLFKCILNPPGTPCSQDTQFQSDLQSSIAGLSSEYAKLDEEIHCTNPDDGTHEPYCTDPDKQIPKLVLITEYFDPTHDKDGNFPSGATNLACTGTLVNASEWKFLYDNVVVPLNQQVDFSPWHPVFGIQGDFLKHGYCAESERWVRRIDDSFSVQNNKEGTGHPNESGQEDYRNRIHTDIVELNPPVTTASATTGGAPYAFGTWTNQDVEVTLSAKNPIKESGLRGTFYAVDNPDCQYNNDYPDNPPGCSVYGGPYTISTTGQHTVTFFSENSQGNPEAQQSAQVLIDKNPPLSMNPGIQATRPRQSIAYTVDVGHFGWENQTVDLSCTTDDPRVTCTMAPNSVTLDQTSSNSAVALVSFVTGSTLIKPGAPTQLIPTHMLEALRALLALAAGLFLAAAGLSLRRRRWARLSSFAALAVLFGTLCAGCGEPPAKTYTVTVTGVSGNTTNTASSTLVVQ
jgi:hypothetical protein